MKEERGGEPGQRGLTREGVGGTGESSEGGRGTNPKHNNYIVCQPEILIANKNQTPIKGYYCINNLVAVSSPWSSVTKHKFI